MTITLKLRSGLNDVIGLPVKKGTQADEIIGTVVEYDKDSGDTVIEVDEKTWKMINENNRIYVSVK
jgi:hypothetical protein